MTPGDLRARVQADYPDAEWHNECAGWAYYVCRVTGTVRRAYPSATDARNASVIVSRDVSKAPAGAFHFWSYPARIEGVYRDWGHVAPSLGNGLAVMTDPESWEDDWGHNLGVTDVVAWTSNRRGIVTYLGWARSYGENTANITTDAASGGDTKPFPTDPAVPEEEDDDMGFYFYDASDPAKAYGFWNESRGKARLISKAEWDWRQAARTTRGGAALTLVPVSKNWYDKAIALGTY